MRSYLKALCLNETDELTEKTIEKGIFKSVPHFKSTADRYQGAGLPALKLVRECKILPLLRNNISLRKPLL